MNYLRFFTFFIFISICSSCDRNKLNEGLILHCPFDVDARDLSTFKRNGALRGVQIDRGAVVGEGCALFDGQNDYVTFPKNQIFFNGSYSISIWCYWQTDQSWTRILDFNHDKAQMGNAITWLLGRKDKTTMPMWFDQWVLHENRPTESIVDFNRNDPSDADLFYDMTPAQWEHYVITYDSEAANTLNTQINSKGFEVPLKGEVTLYVNGKKNSSSHFCLNPLELKTINNWLGRSAYPSDPFFKGKMDDFRIYNRVLTADEITKLYQLKND